jgi:excisionase family DNA binding protein
MTNHRKRDGSKMLTPQTLGLTKAAYSVTETLTVLSIGRTSLYEAVKNGDLRPAKLGKKTLFLADDLAAFLSKLRGEPA